MFKLQWFNFFNCSSICHCEIVRCFWGQFFKRWECVKRLKCVVALFLWWGQIFKVNNSLLKVLQRTHSMKILSFLLIFFKAPLLSTQSLFYTFSFYSNLLYSYSLECENFVYNVVSWRKFNYLKSQIINQILLI